MFCVSPVQYGCELTIPHKKRHKIILRIFLVSGTMAEAGHTLYYVMTLNIMGSSPALLSLGTIVKFFTRKEIIVCFLA